MVKHLIKDLFMRCLPLFKLFSLSKRSSSVKKLTGLMDFSMMYDKHKDTIALITIESENTRKILLT